MRVKRVFSLLLALCLLCGCADTAARPDTDFSALSYETCDADGFLADCGRLASARPREAVRLYRALYGELTELRTRAALAQLLSRTGTDCAEVRVEESEATDALKTALRDALCTRAKKALTRELGEALSSALAEYEPLTDRERELASRESELTARYNEILRAPLSLRAKAERTAKLLTELIALREEAASIRGYDSYAAFAYREKYGRDCAPEETETLEIALRSLAKAYFALPAAQELPAREYGAEELSDLLLLCAEAVSPRCAEAAAYLREQELLYFSEEETALSGAFTVYLPALHAPCLFVPISRSEDALRSTLHEFGHAYALLRNADISLLAGAESFDLCEFHSAGMELLCAETLGEERTLSKLIESAIGGCIGDELAQSLYASPPADAEELTERVRSIYESYGISLSAESAEELWVYDTRLLSAPFYSLSYTAGALTALSLCGREDARELYLALAERGTGGIAFRALLAEYALPDFLREPEQCCETALERLSVLRGNT